MTNWPDHPQIPPDAFALASAIDETIILNNECGTTIAPLLLRALNHRGWFLVTENDLHPGVPT